MPYPNFTRAERIADGMVHVLGVIAAIIGVTALLYYSAHQMGWGIFTATVIYATGLIAMLSASAIYHLAAHTPARPILRRLDHAAIYIKIAATFTPLSVILNTSYGYLILACVWALALFGVVGKLTAKRGAMTTGWWPYLALGWIGLALFIPLMGVLTGYSLLLLLSGGLLYSTGVVFYRWEGLKYATAIWHGFIVIASGCFFLGISSALASGG
ncbi:FIG01964566: Predicted membrane protein, hemolysin III homolog [hydrothermal vent metagenome]|uniref:FIG01964566: Predicted membrane protein, hemolysin III homolog n=1 Tax=hydrothermal vent metagenome TaxID=652676 RepID=A0A3B0SGY2_9ZZZZ